MAYTYIIIFLSIVNYIFLKIGKNIRSLLINLDIRIMAVEWVVGWLALSKEINYTMVLFDRFKKFSAFGKLKKGYSKHMRLYIDVHFGKVTKIILKVKSII